MFKRIKEHLSDNTGMAYMEKLVLIAIAFVVGGILIAGLWGALKGEDFQNGMSNSVGNMFNW